MQSCTKITAEEAFEGQRGPMAEQPVCETAKAGKARERSSREQAEKTRNIRGRAGTWGEWA